MTVEEKAAWFDSAMRFGLMGSIQLVMKSKINGTAYWAIYDAENKKILNSNLEWEEEPPVSKRDEGFLRRSRFSFEDAVNLFNQYKTFVLGAA